MSEFKKIKVYSNTLKKTFEVNTYEVLDEFNNSIIVISHKSLETIAVLENLNVAIKVVKAERDHAVVLAKIGNITKIGEAVTETLTGRIWPVHPVTCAMQRAQDRAIIAYLQLPGDKPYYSSREYLANEKQRTVSVNGESGKKILPDTQLIIEQSQKKFNFGEYKNWPICACPLSYLQKFVNGEIPGFDTAGTMKNIVNDYLLLVEEGLIKHSAA